MNVPPPTPLRIAVVTGSRAEFGLLKPVMRAIHEHPELELLIIAAGSHLAQAGETYRDVKTFAKQLRIDVADAVPMQIDGKTERPADAEAVGAGISKFTRAFMRLNPDWVVVLGDRIEAFAAAAAASIGGWALAHLHGGDRAEGVADEAMRHAITKLAHLHLPATPQSADRIIRMGEPPSRVHAIGSPAVDGLGDIPEITTAQLTEFGFESAGSDNAEPEAVFLMHPIGRDAETERAAAAAALASLRGSRVLALSPNLDPGREGIVAAIEQAREQHQSLRPITHLPRDRFIGLLKRLARTGGVLVGNSSAGLIEAAPLKVRVVDIGDRQAGRERARNVVHADDRDTDAVARAIQAARSLELFDLAHPFGDGRAGDRAAQLLARNDPREPGFTRKRCSY